MTNERKLSDRDKLTAILIQILDFSGVSSEEQEKIYNTISSGLGKADVDTEAYLVWQIMQIVNDQLFDVSRN